LSFVDTKDLDGETNLKEKMVNPEFLLIGKNELCHISGVIKCDMPNEYLDSWEGNLFSDNLKINTNSIIKNLLLKGSILKNTEYVIGIIVYCGFNTKIMKNTKNPRIKMSYVMKTMNFILKTVFLFQITCCLLFSLAYIIFTDKKEDYLSSYIISSHEITVRIFVIKFFTFLVAYSHLIPISLYVAMEIVKILQTWFIYFDNILYDTQYKKPSYARTSELIEELGQVEFIFSDKTGTLTVNKMEFKSCFIGGVLYGDFEQDGEMIEDNYLAKRHNLKIDKSINNDEINEYNNADKSNDDLGDNNYQFAIKNDQIKNEKELCVKGDNNIDLIHESNEENDIDYEKYIEKEKLHFAGDRRIANILTKDVEENEIQNAFNYSYYSISNNKNDRNNNFNNDFNEPSDNLYEKFNVLPDSNLTILEFKRKLINFFRICVLCHSAINEKDKNGKYKFASSSPDEIAFLQGAKTNGFTFSKRTTNMIEINNSYTKQLEKWEILLEIPFESDRQCMTMILKKYDDETNLVHIMVKGADNKIAKMLKIEQINMNSMNSINLNFFYFYEIYVF